MRNERATVVFVVAICVLVWLIPVTLAFISWTISETATEDAVSAPAQRFTVVGSREDAGRVSVVVDVSSGPEKTARSSSNGLVTEVNVGGGVLLSDGLPLLSIDGQKVVAFAQPTPLYRDLSRGMQGPDVRALQAFLQNVGVLAPGPTDQIFGPATSSAVSDFQRGIGVPATGVFSPTYVVYVGTSFTVLDVDVAVGESVDPTTVLLTGTSPTVSAEVRDTELQLVSIPNPDDSVLTVQGNDLPISGARISGEEAAELGVWLASTGISSELIDGSEVRRYSGLQLRALSPELRGSIPTTAALVGTDGGICVFTEDGSAIALQASEIDEAELGVLLVPAQLIGESIHADTGSLPEASRELCA